MDELNNYKLMTDIQFLLIERVVADQLQAFRPWHGIEKGRVHSCKMISKGGRQGEPIFLRTLIPSARVSL